MRTRDEAVALAHLLDTRQGERRVRVHRVPACAPCTCHQFAHLSPRTRHHFSWQQCLSSTLECLFTNEPAANRVQATRVRQRLFKSSSSRSSSSSSSSSSINTRPHFAQAQLRASMYATSHVVSRQVGGDRLLRAQTHRCPCHMCCDGVSAFSCHKFASI